MKPWRNTCNRSDRSVALKSTIYKARLAIADMDRPLYADHALTLARHPSETEERLMMRVLAFALATPADDQRGALTFTAGLSDADVPALWQQDLTGALVQWVEVGLPDERRIAKACGRAERVIIYAFGPTADAWWRQNQPKLARWSNLQAWLVPLEASRALAELAARSMDVQVTVQDGGIWVGDGARSIHLEPLKLTA